MKDLALFTLTNQFENDRVIVNHLFFPAHSQTKWHKHEHDYVIVPMEDAELRMETNDGEITASLKKGECYFRNAGNEHNVINDNDFDVTLIEVELR